MEMKKAKKAQLGRKHGLYFNLGLVLALAFVISAFEWKSYGDRDFIPDDIFLDDVILDDVLPTDQPPPKPPKPKPQVILTIVDDDEIIDDIPNIDVEINPEDITPEFIPEPIVDEPEDEPFIWAEKMPEFDGGDAAFLKYVGKRIKYPSQARKMGIEGKCSWSSSLMSQGN